MNRPLSKIVLTCLLATLIAMAAGCATASSPNAQSSGAESAGALPSGQSSAQSSESFAVVNDVAASSSSASSASSASAKSEASESALAKKLKGDIKDAVEQSGMEIGVCAIDLESGDRAEIDGDKRFVSASMIKLAIAASLLEAADAGDLSLNDTYTLQDSDIVGGTGSLGGRGAGAEVTYDELLESMISESDNTATNIVIDKLGMDAVNKCAKKLGVKKTELNRLMMDEDAIAAGVENYTSANDVALVLELAHKGKLVDRKSSDLLLDALGAQQDDTGILAGLPSNVAFAHKTGALGTVQHDGGIAECEHDFIIVTLCGGDGFSLDGATTAMAEIGKIAYDDIVGSEGAA